MSGIVELRKRYKEFKRNWDAYTFQERQIILHQFRKELYELDDKPLKL